MQLRSVTIPPGIHWHSKFHNPRSKPTPLKRENGEKKINKQKKRNKQVSHTENNDVPILMEVTRRPHALSTTPMLLAVTPFPRPLTTPPVTNTYFILHLVSINR